MVRIVSLFAVAWLVLVAGVAAAEPPSPDNAAGVGNDILGVVPTQAAAHSQAGGGAKAGSNLTYHGGKVLLTNKTVAIYWSPSNAIGSGSSYSSLINQYFGDVAAASGTTGNVYAVETQYYNGANAHIAYSSTFTGAVYDSQPYPASGCSDSVSQTTTCLSDASSARRSSVSTAPARSRPTRTRRTSCSRTRTSAAVTAARAVRLAVLRVSQQRCARIDHRPVREPAVRGHGHLSLRLGLPAEQQRCGRDDQRHEPRASRVDQRSARQRLVRPPRLRRLGQVRLGLRHRGR